MSNIIYAPYSRVYHGEQYTLLEIRRGETVWASDFGDLELDIKAHHDGDELVIDWCNMGWGNDGPAIDWEWFATTPEEAKYQYWNYEFATENDFPHNNYWKEDTPPNKLYSDWYEQRMAGGVGEDHLTAFEREWLTDEGKAFVAGERAWEATAEINRPGYALWEHIRGEAADERIKFWLSHLPKDGLITVDLTGDEPVTNIEYYNKEQPNE